MFQNPLCCSEQKHVFFPQCPLWPSAGFAFTEAAPVTYRTDEVAPIDPSLRKGTSLRPNGPSKESSHVLKMPLYVRRQPVMEPVQKQR